MSNNPFPIKSTVIYAFCRAGWNRCDCHHVFRWLFKLAHCYIFMQRTLLSTSNSQHVGTGSLAGFQGFQDESGSDFSKFIGVSASEAKAELEKLHPGGS
jgi:hypothetical protein